LQVTLVHNPEAGDGAFPGSRLVEAIEAAGHGVRYQSTKKDGWERALQEPSDLVVAAGGDGTVAKVFKRLAGPGAPLVAVLPLGSANNVARTLGFDAVDPTSLIARLDEAPAQQYDLGSIVSDAGEELFVESFGGGLFGDVLESAGDDGDDRGGEAKLDYSFRLIEERLDDVELRRWELELDDRDLSGEYLAVEALLVRETGPNIPLAPEADSADGLFDVVLVRERDRNELRAYVDARRAERPAPPPQLERSRAHRVRLAGGPMHVDDDPWSPEGPIVATAGDARVRVVGP
jgi:diacylglycerol kinase (ATP)